MGNQRSSENDQLAVAHVAISLKDGNVDERSINFISNAIDLVMSTIPAA